MIPPLSPDAPSPGPRSSPGTPDDRVFRAAGSQVGPFRLDGVIGKGGSSLVYRGVRVTGGFEQEVAVKLFHEPPTPETRRNFRRERAILASLRHPHIASLLDAGVTDDDLAYLVMERVDGVPLSSYLRTRAPGLEERLRLFLRICEAVAFAHGQLVVHGDLKPSNVLVTDDGIPKLLDFGVARLLPSEAGGSSETLHQSSPTALSPAYASPEQVQGNPVTVASDLFQLGTLLYEMLSGHHPLAHVPANPAALMQAICEAEPPPPSRMQVAGDPGDPAIQLRLRGDLDAIVLTCLRKEPSARYGSVAELVEDLRRHQDGLPVRARPASTGYRVRTFARRHRVGVALAGAALVATAAGVWGVMAHSRQVALERDRAAMEARRAEAVTGFLLDLFEEASDSGTRDTMTVGTLIQRGEARLADRVEEHPEVRLDLMNALVRAYEQMGMELAALAIHDRRVEAAVDAFGVQDPRAAAVFLEAGQARRVASHWEEALSLLEASLRVWREDGDPRLTRTLSNLGVVYREMGRPDDAVAVVREMMALRADNGEGDEASEAARMNELGMLAFALRGQDRMEEAEELYLEAVAYFRERDPEGSVRHPLLLATQLNNYASLLRGMGRTDEAELPLREALALLDAHGDALDHRRETTSINLVSLFSTLDRPDDAAEQARELERWLLASLDEDHWRVGRARQQVGVSYLRGDRCPEAMASLASSEAIYQEALGDDHRWTLQARVLRAVCQERLGDAEGAYRALSPALAVLREGSTPMSILEVGLESLAEAAEALGRGEEAEAVRQELEALRTPD